MNDSSVVLGITIILGCKGPLVIGRCLWQIAWYRELKRLKMKPGLMLVPEATLPTTPREDSRLKNYAVQKCDGMGSHA
uniref:Uncharacterized protein n=1 Tax=Glossina morsitans morsitans TaxID=37546 RepID=A0A1B0GD17_GLOMM